MNEQDFQTKLGELMKQIEALPPGERGPLEKLAATYVKHVGTARFFELY